MESALECVLSTDLAFLSLQYDDVTVKIIKTAGNIAGSTSVKMADRMSRIRVEKNQAKTRGKDVLKT